MDTSRTNSYVSLKLIEIQKRFEELGDDDLSGLSLEDSDDVTDHGGNAYNPYNHG